MGLPQEQRPLTRASARIPERRLPMRYEDLLVKAAACAPRPGRGRGRGKTANRVAQAGPAGHSTQAAGLQRDPAASFNPTLVQSVTSHAFWHTVDPAQTITSVAEMNFHFAGTPSLAAGVHNIATRLGKRKEKKDNRGPPFQATRAGVEVLAPLTPPVRMLYGGHSGHLFHHEPRHAHTMYQAEGGEQDDPLMLGLFAGRRPPHSTFRLGDMP